MKILTFDIEDWFHILDLPLVVDPKSWSSYENRLEAGVIRILDLLDGENVRATFFVLGWVAERYPAVVREIAERGYEIGSHSHTHKLVYNMERKQFVEDLHRSVSTIENITGQNVRLYRAPGFSITKECLWAFEALIENGIEIDCSLFSPPRRHGGLPQYKVSEPCRLQLGKNMLKEFPMSFATIAGKVVVFSGGGYFRLFPAMLVRALTSRQSYMMTYFHPRDFDPGQPHLPMSRLREWQTYVGLNHALEKLKYLLHSFQFEDIATVEKVLDWDHTPIIKLKL